MAEVESYHYGVTPIHALQHAQYPMRRGEKRRTSLLGIGTGFFYQEGEIIYLITNRHVVFDEEKKCYPNVLEIILHTNRTNIRDVRVIHIPLYDSVLNPLWLEQSHLEDLFIDVVAIDLKNYLQEDRDVLFRWQWNDLGTRSQIRALETHIRVLGYPLGFHDDVHNVPIAKHATIASPYGVAFKDEAYYLIDGNLHPGMSGSPVIIPHSAIRMKDRSAIHSLLGIYSGGWELNGIDLGLGRVWFPDLIHEIISVR